MEMLLVASKPLSALSQVVLHTQSFKLLLEKNRRTLELWKYGSHTTAGYHPRWALYLNVVAHNLWFEI